MFSNPTKLPAGLIHSFRTLGRERTVSPGVVLIHAGDVSSDVFFLESGRVRFTLLSAAGRQPILSEVGPGSLFGELAAIDGEPRAAIACAQRKSQLWILSREKFMSLLKDDWDNALWVMTHLSALLRYTTQRNFQLATMPVSARLACELLSLVTTGPDETSKPVILTLPTHSEIAARIGTHREAITRELGKLNQAGIIDKNNRSLTILDMDRLQAHIEETQR